MNTPPAMPARLVIDGEIVPVGGALVGETFLERKDLRLVAPDVRARRRLERLTFGVLHTTQGIAIPALERGAGPDAARDRFVAQMWRRDRRAAGAHIVIDFDGSIVCCADIVREAASHASTCNGASYGLEVCQRPRSMGAKIWEIQIESAARCVDLIARRLSLPRTVPCTTIGDIDLRFRAARPAQLPPGVGVWGHCNVSLNRGPGDPGPWIQSYLLGVLGWTRAELPPMRG